MRAILLLATIVAAVYAMSYKMETRSPGSLRARLIKDNLYQKYLKEQQLHRVQALKTGSQPLYDYLDEFYIGNVTFGTPGQTVSLLVDTGTANLWVIDSTCNSVMCNSELRHWYIRRKFNSSASSTLTNQNTTLSIQYPYGLVIGPLVKDTVSLGGLAIKQQEFLDATEMAGAFPFLPFDGVLGLAWPANAIGNVTPPMQNLLPSLDAPLFTVWLDRKFNISLGGGGGLITYGAIDNTNCESDIDYVPLSSETYWQFTIEGFAIGSFWDSKTEEVISDTGTSWIGAPLSMLEVVMNETKAVYDEFWEFYTVDCSTMKDHPALVFTINDVDYKVPSEEFILDLGYGPKKCVVALFAMNSGGFGPAWILGDPFIRTYCNIYDIGQQRIGLARAIHSES